MILNGFLLLWHVHLQHEHKQTGSSLTGSWSCLLNPSCSTSGWSTQWSTNLKHWDRLSVQSSQSWWHNHTDRCLTPERSSSRWRNFPFCRVLGNWWFDLYISCPALKVLVHFWWSPGRLYHLCPSSRRGHSFGYRQRCWWCRAAGWCLQYNRGL